VSAPATFTLDGRPVPFNEGQTILQAAIAAGAYIPHLCFHPDFAPHGSCKVCTVKVGGRHAASCTTRAAAGAVVESDTPDLNAERRALVQMLFVEGNHFCPSCEKSGDCKLQATAYDLGMASPHFDHFYPDRPVDASHPDILLDFNRCILCSLCVRASRDVDRKNVFALAWRGIRTRLIVNSRTGRLADTDFSHADKAAHVCPVGVILHKRRGFDTPIGRRVFDLKPISARADATAEIATVEADGS
jgi:[NiFe] hydrogenase diaphorase moiety small subunit